MPKTRAVLIPTACALLAACAANPAPPPAPAAQTAKAAVPAQPVPPNPDGVYQGTSTRFQADRRDCPHPGLLTLIIQDQQFEFRWDRKLSIDAEIGPDGTVRGLGPDVTLTGHLSGRTLSGDVTNGACGLHFTARREV